MTEITLHTGEPGSRLVVNLDWHDHNNIKHDDRLEIRVLRVDKPRTIQLILNNVIVATIESQ
jgi:hypothetical protein